MGYNAHVSIPVIGIPAGPDPVPHPEADPVWMQFRVYVDALSAAGGAPLLIPPSLGETALRAVFDRCDGLCLAGGPDVDPSRYGVPADPVARVVCDPVRDRCEFMLAGWAVEGDRPVLGICRGAEVLNVVFGGTLWQDIPTQRPGDVVHIHEPMQESAHSLAVVEGSRLASVIGGRSLLVNSTHHQGIRDLGAGLVASAHAPDGLVEGIEAPGRRFVLGVQWHPEEIADRPASRALFSAFVEAGARRAWSGGRGDRHGDD
jgi:putative glutamine amidotransferase